MMGIQSSKEIGFALMQAGLSPFSLDTDMFQIVHMGENFIVYTDRLPEVYIEKRVPLDLFEYKRENWIVCFAMDRVNLRRTTVVVFRGEALDTVTFRICIRPGAIEEFRAELDSCFTRIEQAIDAFGQACEVAVRDDDKDTMSELMEGLSDPSAASIWLHGKISS
ncbi:MAG: hypothetical protein IKW89_03980 [Bacteroidales bacterium]|nr:hypothetical protein [Bacteroidales bacterium]